VGGGRAAGETRKVDRRPRRRSTGEADQKAGILRRAVEDAVPRKIRQGDIGRGGEERRLLDDVAVAGVDQSTGAMFGFAGS